MNDNGPAGQGVTSGMAPTTSPSIVISGNAYVGKLIVVQHATSITIHGNASLIRPSAVASAPVSLSEQVGALEFQVDRLLRTPENVRTTESLIAACRMAQNIIKSIVLSAECNVHYARVFLDRMIAVVKTLTALTSYAEALLADIADLHGAARDYYAAMAQTEALVQSPTRRRSTDDLMSLGTWMLNAGDYRPAQRVFEAVSNELMADGPMSPYGNDEQLMQLSRADQFRLLWIPHEMGSPLATMRAAPALLRRVHGTYPALEQAILHRLGRAQGDLGALRRNRKLITQ